MTGNDCWPQLQMVWPGHLLHAPPAAQVPTGYALRAYRTGDEARFHQVMALAGWPGWDDAKLWPWYVRLVPEGWFMAVDEASGLVVATAMALHDHTWHRSSCGELGWLAGDPAHAGRGLGMAVAAVTARFIEIGYCNIHLFTEHWRLAAIKIYLKLGYIPFLYTPESEACWRMICQQLQWPFTPQSWQSVTNQAT